LAFLLLFSNCVIGCRKSSLLMESTSRKQSNYTGCSISPYPNFLLFVTISNINTTYRALGGMNSGLFGRLRFERRIAFGPQLYVKNPWDVKVTFPDQ
jgi:hypothetical protein